MISSYKSHQHNWQRTEKYKYGAIFNLHVCLDHDKPFIKAYDMLVEDPSQFQGQVEYDMRTKKS